MSTDFAIEKLPARIRVLDLLRDLQWHGFQELHEVGGVRYSARLLELRRLGYDIVTEGQKKLGLRYRLVSPRPGARQGKRVKVFLREQDAITLLAVANRDGMTEAREALADAIGSFQTNRYKL